MTIREAIDAIVSHARSLSEAEAADVMRDIMSGEATPAPPVILSGDSALSRQDAPPRRNLGWGR